MHIQWPDIVSAMSVTKSAMHGREHTARRTEIVKTRNAVNGMQNARRNTYAALVAEKC